MKRLFILLFNTCSIFSFGQNVGINTAVPTAVLDVNGDFILRSGDLTLANGNNLVDVGTVPYSNYRITGPTAGFNVTGLSYSSDGKLVTLFNRSGFTMTVVNESPAEAISERIITGTGADVTIPNNASVNFQYDLGAVRWVLRNHSAAVAGAGGGGGFWASNGSGSISNTNGLNVGIGTAFPGYKLQVAGDGGFYGNGISTINDPQGGLTFIGGGLAISRPYSAIENSMLLISGNQLQSFIREFDDPTTDDYTADLVLNPLGGNMGIGTNLPDANTKLTIQTPADASTALSIRNPSGSAKLNVFVGGPVNGNTISLGTPGAMPIALYTNSANRMFIAANGNIGIGTDNPTFKLAVNGSIRAKELRINTGWADYVFDDSYALQPLEDVEQFIKSNKHLPNIPPAAVLQKEGVDVSDMQTRMMAKIEELTLYLIEANKKIAALQKKLE